MRKACLALAILGLCVSCARAPAFAPASPEEDVLIDRLRRDGRIRIDGSRRRSEGLEVFTRQGRVAVRYLIDEDDEGELRIRRIREAALP